MGNENELGCSNRRKVIITGGAGFFAQTLARDLLERGNEDARYDIELLDVQLPADDHGCFRMVDVRDQGRLTGLFENAYAVFHVASYGMSGSSQLKRDIVRSINVDGTKAVVSACIAAGVERLILTSTYNVVFGGQEIDGGDEAMPYYNMMNHVDEYSRSKTEAEMIVLEANGTPLKPVVDSGGKLTKGILQTCALRPAAIWGKGEIRHMRRVYDYLMKGLFFFRFGSPSARMDFVHVKNLSSAHILAMERLDKGGPSKVAGNAYFVSDGERARIHNFDFFSQLAVGLGYRRPRLWLPLRVVYACAWIFEIAWHIFRIEPMLTRAEVLKAGVHHWCRIDKARNHLGYKPKSYSFDEVIEQFSASTITGEESNSCEMSATTIKKPWKCSVLLIISGSIVLASYILQLLFYSKDCLD